MLRRKDLSSSDVGWSGRFNNVFCDSPWVCLVGLLVVYAVYDGYCLMMFEYGRFKLECGHIVYGVCVVYIYLPYSCLFCVISCLTEIVG